MNQGRCAIGAGLLLSMLTLLAPPAWAAQELQPHDAIRATVRQFLAAGLAKRKLKDPEITIGHMDPRLRLALCTAPLKAFPTGTGRIIGAVTVGVRCTGNRPWTLYVTAKVAVYGDVVVAGEPLRRGNVIEASQLRTERRNLATMTSGYYGSPQAVAGQALKRSLNPGDPVLPYQLTQPKLVRRGEQVTLMAEVGAAQVRMSGKALADGVAGQRVRVRNLSSRRVVEGTVVAPGLIRVSL